MKIICNKSEFAKMVRICYSSNSCLSCALSAVCDGQDSVVAFTDVVEDASGEVEKDVAL